MKGAHALFFLGALWALTSCHPQMGNQAKYNAYEQNQFFADGSSMRPIPTHTVARGALSATDPFHSGKLADGLLVAQFPVPVTPELLAHGRAEFEIFCAVCHGLSGTGDGMIAQRGFPPPPSFHSERLRAAPVGHFFDVIANGYGVMFPYGARVAPADRWAIIAYIRALQLSERATLADVPPEEQGKLEAVRP